MKIHTDYLIIGGGIAGTTAAETIRSRDDRGKIAIMTLENHPLYSRVLLPKYVQGAIRREQVFLRSLSDYEKYRVDLYVDEEMIAIDPAHQEVRTSHDNTFFYKKLLISTGGRVRPPHADGSGWNAVCRLQTIEDADTAIDRIGHAQGKRAIVIGAGFIGMEFINSFVARGFAVDVISSDGGCWFGRVGGDGTAYIERVFPAKGVTMHRASEILLLEKNEEGFMAKTNKGETITGDIVGVGIGIERNMEVFKGQGFVVNRGIQMNKYLETGVEDIWAAGDIAEYWSTVFEQYELVGNWNNAFVQGRIAGLNMAASLQGESTRTAFVDISTYSITALGSYITFVGDAFLGKGKQSVARLDPLGAFYERFFFNGDRLVGAVIINKFEDKKIIDALIKERVSVADVADAFEDPSFDLSTIHINAQRSPH